MKKVVIIGITVLVLLFGLAGAAYASYVGFGQGAGFGNPSARSGSVHGPRVIGGGPGHGK